MGVNFVSKFRALSRKFRESFAKFCAQTFSLSRPLCTIALAYRRNRARSMARSIPTICCVGRPAVVERTSTTAIPFLKETLRGPELRGERGHDLLRTGGHPPSVGGATCANFAKFRALRAPGKLSQKNLRNSHQSQSIYRRCYVKSSEARSSNSDAGPTPPCKMLTGDARRQRRALRDR